MANVIRVDDLAKMAQPIAEAPKVSSMQNLESVLNSVNSILNNPVLNSIINRLVSKYLGGGQQANNPPLPKDFEPAKNPWDENKVYEMIKTTIQNLISMGMGDSKLSDLQKYMIDNEKMVKGLIKDAIKS